MSYNDDNAHYRDNLIDFDPAEHKYYHDGICYESVTTVVDSCFKQFDAEHWAREKCPENPMALIAQWEAKAKNARDLGTLMHDRIERYYLGEKLGPEVATDPTFALFKHFSSEHILCPYRSEWRIFSERYQIAGTLDFLAIEPDGRYIIYDWKRSTKVVDTNGNVITKNFNRYAFAPIDTLPDTTYNHYALQVSIYRFILAEHYGIDVSDAFLGVFHPDMPRYYCVHLPYLRDEVERLLRHRILKS